MTLREVSGRTAGQGGRIPVSTLARIERGDLDPGVRRLHALLRIYDISPHLTADLIELEAFAVEPPEGRDLATLHVEGLEHFRAGRYPEGLAHFIAVQQVSITGPADELLRQKAMLAFGVAARDLGKMRLAKKIVDDLLCTPPDPSILVNVLVLGATTWRALGSLDAALAFIARAEQRLLPGETDKSAWVHHTKAKLLVQAGDASARATLERAMADYRAVRDDRGLAKAFLTRSGIEVGEGDLASAARSAEEAYRIASRGGAPSIAASARIEAGRVALLRSDFRIAVAHLQVALAGFEGLGDKHGQFVARHLLWKTRLAAGETDRARFDLAAARYLADFIDEKSSELDEVRHAAGD